MTPLEVQQLRELFKRQQGGEIQPSQMSAQPIVAAPKATMAPVIQLSPQAAASPQPMRGGRSTVDPNAIKNAVAQFQTKPMMTNVGGSAGVNTPPPANSSEMESKAEGTNETQPSESGVMTQEEFDKMMQELDDPTAGVDAGADAGLDAAADSSAAFV